MSKIKGSWEPEDDWFYEANIQNKIEKHLKSENWGVEVVDTKSRKKGPDILAKKNGTNLQVEVKGYPSDKYVRGKDKGKEKKTNPKTQARHWFAEALLTIILAKCKSPNLKIALGFPDDKIYLKKWTEIKWLREKIHLSVYWVNRDGLVNRER